ncbi:hypothetical protein Tco_1215190 [Tanacetum coccineum]
MGYCLTSRFSKKQTALAISTTEAEYVSVEKACQQALWMKQALVDYGVSAPNAPSKTPSTKDTSSSLVDYIPKSPTSSTSLSPNGFLNPPTSPPPRVSPPPSTQENASMDITLTLSPITPLDVQFDTPSPSPPILGYPIPWNMNSDDEADERSSEEYLRDLDLESPMSNSSSMSKGFQPKVVPKLIQSPQHSQSSQSEPKVQKDYKSKYKKMKAKLALLEASPSTSQALKTFQ